MAEPTKPKKVTINWAMDKVGRRKYLSIAGAVVVLFLGVVFVKHRRQKENPVTRTTEAAKKAAEGMAPPEPPGPGNANVPMDQAANSGQGADDVFRQAMQDFHRQEQEQRKQAVLAQQDQQERAVQQARAEERQRATAQPSVGPDGTPLPAGQQAPTTIPAPPRFDYETSAWVPSGQGRVRPGYQTGALWPDDPTRHQTFEDAYWNGMRSPMVVGLNQESNLASQRLKQDTQSIQGSVGVRGARQAVSVPVDTIRAPQRSSASHWGGWIVVTPQPGQKK